MTMSRQKFQNLFTYTGTRQSFTSVNANTDKSHNVAMAAATMGYFEKNGIKFFANESHYLNKSVIALTLAALKQNKSIFDI